MTAPEDIYSAEWWLWIARVDLQSAEHLLTNPDLPPLVACYHAQQAAEKAIKGALVWLEIEFPFTHNLGTLMRLLPDDWELRDRSKAISDLSGYASRSNYPGNLMLPTRDEALAAVEEARVAIELVELKIQ